MRAITEVSQGLEILQKYPDCQMYVDGGVLYAGSVEVDVTTEDFNELLFLKWENQDRGLFWFQLPEPPDTPRHLAECGTMYRGCAPECTYQARHAAPMLSAQSHNHGNGQPCPTCIRNSEYYLS